MLLPSAFRQLNQKVQSEFCVVESYLVSVRTFEDIYDHILSSLLLNYQSTYQEDGLLRFYVGRLFQHMNFVTSEEV